MSDWLGSVEWSATATGTVVARAGTAVAQGSATATGAAVSPGAITVSRAGTAVGHGSATATSKAIKKAFGGALAGSAASAESEPPFSLLAAEAAPGATQILVPLLGWQDDAPLLGWQDLVPLGEFEAAPIPGTVDAVGGPLGGPVGERVYIISSLLFADWSSQTVVEGSEVSATAAYPTAALPFPVGDGGTPPPEVSTGYSFRSSSVDFATRINDPDLPSVWWDGRLIDPGSISRSIPLVPVGSSAIEVSAGSVVLDNTDGAYDTVLDANRAVSQEVVISAGRMGAFLEDFVLIFRARITGLGMTETAVTLELQDPAAYSQNLFPTTVYTGGGEDDLVGTVKPVVLGRVWNMSPVLIDELNLVYQMHDGAMLDIIAVYDGGLRLDLHGDFPSYAALLAETIPAGEYATCRIAGVLRLRSTPAFTITAHVDGMVAAGTTVRSIATWIAGQLKIQLGMEVDAASFASLPDWTAGWLWNQEFTFAEALSRFVGDAGFVWGADFNGTIRVIQLQVPDPSAIVASYSEPDIMAIERATPPAGFEAIHHRRLVHRQHNWTIQDGDQLAATATGKTYRPLEWRTSQASVSSTSRNAIDPPILDTSLREDSDALALATYLLDLHGVPRRFFSVETRVFGSTLPSLGSTVKLTYPRFGLDSGVALRVIAVDFRLANSAVHLLLWG